MRSLTVLLALGLVLAGCAEPESGDGAADGDGGTGDDPSGDGTSDDGDDGSGDGGNGAAGGSGTNAAPNVTFEANKQSVIEGKAANFTIDASDADGDDLSWSLDADGDGTVDEGGDSFPANATFVFEAVGNYTAMLAVTDGNATTDANLTITVISPDAEAEEGFEPVHLELDVELSCIQCYTTGAAPDNCVGLQAGENGQDCVWVEAESEWIGHDFTTDGPFDVDISFYSECSAGNEQGSVAAEGHDTGTIPDGTGCLVLWNWDAGPGGTIIVDIV